MMPITIIPRQAGCFQCQYCAYIAGTDGRQEPTESRTIRESGSGATQVFIYNDDACEPQSPRTFIQVVLPSLTLQMVAYLVHRRLPHIDVSTSFEMGRCPWVAGRCVDTAVAALYLWLGRRAAVPG